VSLSSSPRQREWYLLQPHPLASSFGGPREETELGEGLDWGTWKCGMSCGPLVSGEIFGIGLGRGMRCRAEDPRVKDRGPG
jgi:hypothetical protein